MSEPHEAGLLGLRREWAMRAERKTAFRVEHLHDWARVQSIGRFGHQAYSALAECNMACASATPPVLYTILHPPHLCLACIKRLPTELG